MDYSKEWLAKKTKNIYKKEGYTKGVIADFKKHKTVGEFVKH